MGIPAGSSAPSSTPRQRFLSFVRDQTGADPVCSPFLPHPTVIQETLGYLGEPVGSDDIENEVRLARHLDYEPMFMADLPGMIFDWQDDPAQSSAGFEVATIQTPIGEWVRRRKRGHDHWNDEGGCPVQAEADHAYFVAACEQVGDREDIIRSYYRDFRARTGEGGVIVIAHPHPSWLGYQISPSMIYYHWSDIHQTFVRSMDALFEAALFVMQIAMDEGIDFMSDSSYGLEMTSPRLFEEMDLGYIQRFSSWTHERDGLFWYHNCGLTRRLIADGYFNRLGADVIETIAPPPEGDNDLAESRSHICPDICTKGNLSLGLLRDGTPDEVADASRSIVEAVDGTRHIYSTADGVLKGTPPENYLTFIQTIRDVAAGSA